MDVPFLSLGYFWLKIENEAMASAPHSLLGTWAKVQDPRL